MEYDGELKRLTVTCEGKSWIHTSDDFPTEARFVFTLAPGRKVRLVPN